MVATRKEIFEKLKDGVVRSDLEYVQKASKEALDEGIPPTEIVSEGLKKGLDIVGQKYEEGERFLADLIMAGETMKEAMKVIEPYMSGPTMHSSGTFVIGTAQGDLHDIGKNIVVTLAKAASFNVVDLGVDVPASRFVDEVRKNDEGILGMSALLSVSMPEIGNVIDGLKKASIRNNVKIIIGGAVITEEFGKSVGANAATRDAVKGIEICKAWVGVT